MKFLVGFLTALIVMIVAYIFFKAFGVDINKVNFFIGWISCMGYYIGMESYEQKNKAE